MDAERPLAGRTALVTGASRGIGFGIAQRLGSLGARVSLCARDANGLESAARKLRAEGIEVLAIPVDVTRANEVTAAVERTNQTLGEIDLLVNNAGTSFFRPIQEATEADWDRVLDTNLKGVFLVSRAVAPLMIRRGRGDIVNIASLAGKNAFATAGVYCASKWGVLGLTYCMAEDLRGYGVRVIAICPGTTATEFSHHIAKDRGKMLQPDDIAHAVAMAVTAEPRSFISEILVRPTQKP